MSNTSHGRPPTPPPTPTTPAPHGAAHAPVADHSPTAAGRAGVCPLWAILTFTFVNSLATGVTFNGGPFLAEGAYSYSATKISALWVLLGVAYIAGALAAGPGIRALKARLPGLSARAVIGWLMVFATALNMLPIAAWFGTAPAQRAATAWSLWVYIPLYSVLCGALWPIVESYMSGGRHGPILRRAIGRFNIIWSSALVLSMVTFSVAKMMPHWRHGDGVAAAELAKAELPSAVVLALIVPILLHVGSMALLWWMPREPAAHGSAGDEPGQTLGAPSHDRADGHGAAHGHGLGGTAPPPVYRSLLAAHRLLLATAYLVLYAMSPLLPDVMKQIGVSEAWAPTIAGTWLAARVGMFALLGQWHGWHGRWGTAIWGTAGLLGGFALFALAPKLGDSIGTGAAQGIVVMGLIIFGGGAAAIYTAALYYVQVVGAAEVDAGGSHEALIGVGYTIGPIASLIPAMMVDYSWLDAPKREPAVLLLVAATATLGIIAAAVAARMVARPRR